MTTVVRQPQRRSGLYAVTERVAVMSFSVAVDNQVHGTDNSAGWFERHSNVVLALDHTRGGELSRQTLHQALLADGCTDGAAAQWLICCAWLRGTGHRGRFRLIGDRPVAYDAFAQRGSSLAGLYA